MIKKIPILTFHSIDSSGSVISIHPNRFKQLLTALKRKGYQTINLNQLIQWLAGKIFFHSPTVVITFDDGFENVYHHALPALNELGFQATVFLTTGYCEKKNNWPMQSSGIPILQMLKWKQIKEMASFGFNFQAHTQTHPYLFNLDTKQLEYELSGSKKEIEDRLGKPVNFFAYPFGYFNRGEELLVGQFFKGVCTTHLDFVYSASDRYLLPRIDTHYFSHQITSKLFLSPLCGSYLRFRRSSRLLRQSLINRPRHFGLKLRKILDIFSDAEL